jgi:RNA methyltransferase, TrmH family
MVDQPVISSRDNVWFRRFRAAAERPQDEIFVEGPKAIGDAIAAGARLIAVATDRDDAPPFVLDRAPLRFSTRLFAALSQTRETQGYLALFQAPQFQLPQLLRPAAGNALVVLLDGVQDPGNVGTIVRLAAAFDCLAVVVLEGTANPYSPKAIRAAAAATFLVPVVRASTGEALRLLEKDHFQLVATSPHAGQASLPAGKVALAFGSEGAGVSQEISSRASAVRIPMSDRVESLNVGAAAAILLSAAYRTRAVEGK